MDLVTRLQAFGIILGAVNADYSFLADVANQERIREYDYGPGAGASIELYLQRKDLPLLTGRYRCSYIDVSNGSTYSGDNVGLGSSHIVHQTQLKLEIPITHSLGIGADASVFFRRSHYDVVQERVPRAPSGAPDDHAAEPRGPPLRELELQPLRISGDPRSRRRG